MLHFILQIDRTHGERLHANPLAPVRHDLDRLGRSAHRIADAVALCLPANGDPFSRRERNIAFGLSERAGQQLQVERVRPSVEPGMKSQHVAGQLPSRRARPLMTVRPARIEHLDPSRAALAQRPAPARAILVEYEIGLAALEKHGKRVMGEIGRDQPGIVGSRIAQPGSGRIVRKAAQNMPLNERDGFLPTVVGNQSGA